MNLPNAHLAVVEERKVREYLLNAAHPEGRAKAKFFRAIGFSESAWRQLAAALREMAQNTPVTQHSPSPYGHKYEIDGELRTPGGGLAGVRSIWIVDRGNDLPRLVIGVPTKLAL